MSVEEFKGWVESAGVQFSTLSNSERIHYRKEFDSRGSAFSFLNILHCLIVMSLFRFHSGSAALPAPAPAGNFDRNVLSFCSFAF